MSRNNSKKGAFPTNIRHALMVGFLSLIATIVIPVFEYRELHLTYVIDRYKDAISWRDYGHFLQAVPGFYKNKLFSPADDAQQIRLDIKLKHLNKIQAKRQEAVQTGVLFTREDDMVPAEMTVDGQKFNIKMRLKGDLTDHLVNDRWSFRIEIKDGESLNGMKKFSIQPPHTRMFQRNALFSDYLREQGLLAPRFSTADLNINGRDIGVMLLEEHFTAELIQSQQRSRSVILKYNESYFWEAWVEIAPIAPDYDNWRNMPVTAFGYNKAVRSGFLKPLLADSIGMLKGVMEERLKPSDVFDADQWGQLLAACEIWDAKHMVFSHQLRMYFNPNTYKLEPIVFDPNIEPVDASQKMVCQGGVYAMMTTLLDDPAIKQAMFKHIRMMTDDILSDDFADWVSNREQAYLPALRRDYPAVSQFPLQELRTRARWLQSVDENNLSDYAPPLRSYADFRQPYGEQLNYPALVYAYVENSGSKQQLTLVNALSKPVVITALDISPYNRAWTEKIRLPITIAPSRRNELPGTYTIGLAATENISWTVSGDVRVEDETRIYPFSTKPGFAALNELPQPSGH
jgi:hypothetical protein